MRLVLVEIVAYRLVPKMLDQPEWQFKATSTKRTIKQKERMFPITCYCDIIRHGN